MSNINNVEDVRIAGKKQPLSNVDMWETSQSGMALFHPSLVKYPETEVFEDIGKSKWNILLREYLRFDQFDHC
jgi:hypothetical protein